MAAEFTFTVRVCLYCSIAWVRFNKRVTSSKLTSVFEAVENFDFEHLCAARQLPGQLSKHHYYCKLVQETGLGDALEVDSLRGCPSTIS